MNIRALREGAGLTQQQLADRVGVSRSTIAQYEAGYTMPGVPVLITLAQVLDADLNELKKPPYTWVGKAEEPPAHYDTADEVTVRAERLLERMRRRHEAQGQDIEELARIIVERRQQEQDRRL